MRRTEEDMEQETTQTVTNALLTRIACAAERLADAQERIAAATEEGQRQAKAAMDTMAAATAEAMRQSADAEAAFMGLPGLRKRG